MCGRFYVPEDSEIAMLRKVMENLESRNVTVKTGEVSPGDVAAVIASNRELKPQPFGMLWGYHLPNGKLLFNARSETAAQKAIFADGMEHRRCAIPAAHYFEWQKTAVGKTKYAIAPSESHGMMLAGIYRFENNKPLFTILTRSPSEDIAMIHDRMPVILPQEALADWLNPHYSGSEILSAALTSMSFHACYYDKLKSYPIDLFLSGHCHGGQIRIWNHGIFSPGQGLLPRYHHGVYDGRWWYHPAAPILHLFHGSGMNPRSWLCG